MLSVKKLSIAYGQHQAVSDVTIDIEPGEVVVILGANGAGKSSLLRAISGLSEGQLSGDISFAGESLLENSSDEIVIKGIALVPEGRAIFGDLSVEENLRLGAFSDRAREREQHNLDRVLTLFPKLRERRRQIARTMSGGEQQMVAIGRALMSDPSILMLDEPSLGLSPLLSQELFAALGQISATGIGVLVVEQNAKLSLSIADRGYLIGNGRIIGEDNAKNLASDPAVQKAYLGGGSAETASPENVPSNATAPSKKPRRVVEVTANEVKEIASAPSAPPIKSKLVPPQETIETPRAKADVNDLIGEDIEGLLKRASETATANIKSPVALSSKPQPTVTQFTPAASEPLPSSADPQIQALLDDFEKSAQNARLSSQPAKTATSDKGPQLRTHRGGLPEIPVFKKKRVEVFNRDSDGNLVKAREV